MDMVQKVYRDRKTIVVKQQTFETLRKMGSVTESFNDVITRLIQKAMSDQQPLVGSAGHDTAEPLQPGGQSA